MPSQVSDVEMDQLVKPIGLQSYRISAKTGEGVEEMFQEICESLIKSTSVKRKQREEIKLRER